MPKEDSFCPITHTPLRRFFGDEEMQATGWNGPRVIAEDLDNLSAMFNPSKDILAGTQKGGIATVNIQDGAIINQKLADNSVTNNKISDNSITSQKIALNSITNDKIAQNSITSEKIANNSITNEKIASNFKSPLATLADKATKDGDENIIKDTYATKASLAAETTARGTSIDTLKGYVDTNFYSKGNCDEKITQGANTQIQFYKEEANNTFSNSFLTTKSGTSLILDDICLNTKFRQIQIIGKTIQSGIATPENTVPLESVNNFNLLINGTSYPFSVFLRSVVNSTLTDILYYDNVNKTNYIQRNIGNWVLTGSENIVIRSNNTDTVNFRTSDLNTIGNTIPKAVMCNRLPTTTNSTTPPESEYCMNTSTNWLVFQFTKSRLGIIAGDSDTIIISKCKAYLLQEYNALQGYEFQFLKKTTTTENLSFNQIENIALNGTIATNSTLLPTILATYNKDSNKVVLNISKILTGTFATRPTILYENTFYLSTDKAAGNADRLTLYNITTNTWLQI